MPYLMARSNASDASPARTEIMAGEQEIAVTVTAVFELRPSQ
jgi:uncharacterized protein YggE